MFIKSKLRKTVFGSTIDSAIFVDIYVLWFWTGLTILYPNVQIILERIILVHISSKRNFLILVDQCERCFATDVGCRSENGSRRVAPLRPPIDTAADAASTTPPREAAAATTSPSLSPIPPIINEPAV
jgi:hypothetical protein